MDLILIPGFWLDGSSWDGVAPALRRAGHRTHALTLPGMRAQDADRSAISLRDHVEAVVAAVDAVDPAAGRVVLVGHSGGGAVAHAAADARPGRIARLVLVDCLPLGDGDAINPELPSYEGGIPLPDWSLFDAADLIGLDDDLRASFRARAIPTPQKVASDPQRLLDDRRFEVPCTVIACEFTSEQVRQWIAQGQPWVQELARFRHVDYMDLPTGHWPQFTRPDDLAGAILGSIADTTAGNAPG